MRNVFDQYESLENRLTHALYCTLVHDRQLIRPFLKWLGIADIPATNELKLVEQRMPGVRIDDEDSEAEGLPDLWIYSDNDWAVVFEMKVQSRFSTPQLERHANSARRFGFERPQFVVVTADKLLSNLSKKTIHRTWSQLYSWFDRHDSESAQRLVDYMEIFEAKAVSNDYEIRGTITMFNGLHFDDDNPYTYGEGKRKRPTNC